MCFDFYDTFHPPFDLCSFVQVPQPDTLAYAEMVKIKLSCLFYYLRVKYYLSTSSNQAQPCHLLLFGRQIHIVIL